MGRGGGGGGVGLVGVREGGCERRIEVFVKIQKKKKFGGGGGGVWLGGVRVDVVLGKIHKKGGRVGGSGWWWGGGGGVRVNVNEELKFL